MDKGQSTGSEGCNSRLHATLVRTAACLCLSRVNLFLA